MSQLLLPVDARLSKSDTLFWSPGADSDLCEELAALGAEVVGYAQNALQGGEADPGVCNIAVDYLRRIRIHAERAWFVTAAASMTGGEWDADAARCAQAAVEIRYWGEIILDDVADESNERCGAPTLHLEEGNMAAVYLGEVLFAAAQTELLRFIERRDPPKALLLHMLNSWTQVHARVNSSQYLDLSYSKLSLNDVSPDEALRLIEGTTAVEVANCFYMGAITGTFDREAIDAIHRLGMIVGLLMQARDDCLDLIDDADLLNKEPLCDIRNGRKKVAVVVGYHHADANQREEIKKIIAEFGKATTSDIERLRELIFNPLARAYMGELRKRLLKEAERILGDPRWDVAAAHRVRRFLDR